MSPDNKSNRSGDRKKRSTKELARPWLNRLASRGRSSRRQTNVPLKTQKQSDPQQAVPRSTRPARQSAKGVPVNPSNRQGRPIRRKSYRGWWIGGFVSGFIIGLIMSLFYGWVLDPRPLPVGPAQLASHAQETYIRLVALAYFHDEDETRARDRISKLEITSFQVRLVMLAEQYIQDGRDIRDIRALVTLADALGPISGEMVVFLAPTTTPTTQPTPTNTVTAEPFTSIPTNSPSNTPTLGPIPVITSTRPITLEANVPSLAPVDTATKSPTATLSRTPTITPTPSSTSTPTSTPFPTRTPTLGPDSPYGVAMSAVVCDSANGGLLKIYIRDRLGSGVPGVKILISWPGGSDTLFTGFKPDIDPGYADYQMDIDETYQVALVNVDTFESASDDISISDRQLCSDLPDTIAPSWQIEFEQGVN